MDFSKRSTWLILAGIFFFVGFLVYGHSLNNEFVRWDDGLLIFENPAIRGITFQNLKTIFTTYDPELYIPWTLLTYQVDYLIGGTNPAIYHAHNLTLHILNAILVIWCIYELTRKRAVAILCAAFFLLHPLNTEAVAWASGRKDLISTFYFLVSIGLHMRYKATNGKWFYRWSIITFLIGLLSKVTVLTLPAVLILIEWWQGRLTKKTFKELIPYVLLSIIFAVIAYMGKTGVIDSSTPLEKILIAPLSTVFYLQKLFLPTALAVIYPFTGAVELLSLRVMLPILICIALLILGITTLKRNTVIFFALAWFVITLAPSLLNFSKGDFLYFASDRYAYIPSIGMLLLLSLFIDWLTKKWQSIPVYGAAVILAIFGVLSFRQSLVWANSESLFSHNIIHYPEAHTAHNNLGNVKRSKGDVTGAIASYEEALRLSEEFGRGSAALYGRARILANLASSHRANGNREEAAVLLDQAERADPTNPYVFLQRGILYADMGEVAAADAAYQKALVLMPGFTTAKINRASLWIAQGRYEDAIAILTNATEENPFYPQAYYNLGIALRHLQRNREAKEAYEKAVELEPSFVAARINLGILYAERKDIDEAISQFEEVLRYDPQNARALDALRQLGAR